MRSFLVRYRNGADVVDRVLSWVVIASIAVMTAVVCRLILFRCVLCSGFIFVIDTTPGAITPPLGILLFVSSGIWRIQVVDVIKEIWPFVIVQYLVLFVCVMFPDIVLFLPRLVGY